LLTIRNCFHLFSRCPLQNLRNSERIRSYSRSRSSKFIDLSDNRKRICDFLLVINSNFGRIPYLFEILTFKARKLLGFHTHPLFDAPARAGGVRISGWNKLILYKLEGWGYCMVKIFRNPNFNRFYRAMHFSAKRGIAITCRLSVRLSVCNVGELW